MSTADFQTYLSSFSESDWLSAVETLSPDIHEVDRNPTQVWFRFYPLEFRHFVENHRDEADVRRSLGLLGDYDLADQIDTSHKFLYGHRYWSSVKSAIEAGEGSNADQPTDIVELIKTVAASTAKQAKTDVSLTLGIAAVGLMTLNQVGLEKFKAAK